MLLIGAPCLGASDWVWSGALSLFKSHGDWWMWRYRGGTCAWSAVVRTDHTAVIVVIKWMNWNLAIALKVVNLRGCQPLGRPIRLEWATSWLFHAFRRLLTLITGISLGRSRLLLLCPKLLLQAWQTICLFWIGWDSRIQSATACKVTTCKVTAHYNLRVMFGWLLLGYMLLLFSGRGARLLLRCCALTRASIRRTRPRR